MVCIQKIWKNQRSKKCSFYLLIFSAISQIIFSYFRWCILHFIHSPHLSCAHSTLLPFVASATSFSLNRKRFLTFSNKKVRENSREMFTILVFVLWLNSTSFRVGRKSGVKIDQSHSKPLALKSKYSTTSAVLVDFWQILKTFMIITYFSCEDISKLFNLEPECGTLPQQTHNLQP